MISFRIALRELHGLFVSPLAWSLLAVVQVVMAWLFLLHIDLFVTLQPRMAGLDVAPGVTDLVAAPVLHSAAIVLLLMTPLVSMRLFSDEFRTGSFNLLLSSPVSITQIVLGKYLGLLSFLLLCAALIALMPLSLLAGANLDLGKLAAGLVGLGLLLSVTAAIGMYASSLTQQPAAAGVGAYGILVFLAIIGLAADAADEGAALFQWLSILSHYRTFLRGSVDTGDTAYYLLLAILFLVLTIRRLDSLRAGH